VALKVLKPELSQVPEMVQRFVREALVVQQLGHPNVANVYDFGTLPDGRPFMAMELLAGSTLAALVQEHGRVPPERALAYLRPVCAALDAAHQAGVVHRDLKASNVMVVDAGPVPQVKLLDFGIAKLLLPDRNQPALTGRGQRLGTGFAMAPEQIRGGLVDERIDLYALGVLSHFLLTGAYPFAAADPVALERLHLEATPPRVSRSAPVPGAVDDVVLRCLEKQPERRFQTVPEFLRALEAAVHARAPGVTRSEHAVGIHVEWVEGAGEEDADTPGDFLFDTECALRQAGCAVALSTSSAVLALRVLSGDAPQRERARQEALDAARRVRAMADEAGGAVARGIRVQAHLGDVDLAGEGISTDVQGGPLLRVDQWPVQRTQPLSLSAALSGTR
jgi:serine/threonine protein kinase